MIVNNHLVIKKPCNTIPHPRSGLFLKPPFSAAVESPITKIVVVFVLDVISNASMNTYKIAFIFSFVCSF